jgi:hypothetical protein
MMGVTICAPLLIPPYDKKKTLSTIKKVLFPFIYNKNTLTTIKTYGAWILTIQYNRIGFSAITL